MTGLMRGVKVWDLPSRIAHWALGLSILGSYGTAEYGWFSMQWHFYFGYAVITLVIFRVLWGFFGSEHARFRNFVRGPGAVWRYLKTFGDKDGVESTGHNARGTPSRWCSPDDAAPPCVTATSRPPRSPPRRPASSTTNPGQNSPQCDACARPTR